MDGCNGSGGGNRRRFLKATAAAGAALASADRLLAADPPAESPVPTVTLGKTGQKVTKLGMGTSWALSPSFVQARPLRRRPLHRHVRELREHASSEKVLGEVLERTKMRKDVYLVTKSAGYRKATRRGGAPRSSRSTSTPASSGSRPTTSTPTTSTASTASADRTCSATRA